VNGVSQKFNETAMLASAAMNFAIKTLHNIVRKLSTKKLKRIGEHLEGKREKAL
jgi:hypothetical protein